MYAAPKALNEGALVGGTDKRTRLQRLEDESREPQLPPLPFGTYLLKIFFKVGPVSFGSMSAIPITEEAMGWYQVNRGIRLSPWELDTLRELSVIWISESKLAERHDAPPPFQGQLDAEYRREKLPNFIRSFLRE